jgi:hypothetical protein
MRANLLTAGLSAVAALAMNSVYCGSMSSAGSWLGTHAPSLIARILWNGVPCVLSAMHAWSGLAAMVLMTVLASASRR